MRGSRQRAADWIYKGVVRRARWVGMGLGRLGIAGRKGTPGCARRNGRRTRRVPSGKVRPTYHASTPTQSRSSRRVTPWVRTRPGPGVSAIRTLRGRASAPPQSRGSATWRLRATPGRRRPGPPSPRIRGDVRPVPDATWELRRAPSWPFKKQKRVPFILPFKCPSCESTHI